MPPRRSERVAAVAERATSALSPLPPALVQQIFLLLAVDERARCACVCRGWRAAVSERCLWTRLDVSRTSGVRVRVTNAFLRGAAARAGGALEALDVSACAALSREALLAVATANAGTLCELRACHGVRTNADLTAPAALFLPDAEALLRAAPQLRVLYADVEANIVADVCRALSAAGEGLLAPLRVHDLRVRCDTDTEGDVLALAADIASHAWLRELCLVGALPTPAALDAVVDAVLARPHIIRVQFVHCHLNPASAPALARLLTGSAVANLSVLGDGGAALLDAPSATLLAGALRANTTLTSLQLTGVSLWGAGGDVAAVATLLGALTAQPSLRTLILSYNIAREEAQRVAAGVALGTLVANAPALTELDVRQCALGDVGMAPLCAALRRNAHLRALTCFGNALTEAFTAVLLLSAVRANASLRALNTGRRWPAEREAEEVVSRRAAAAGDDR
jgi:hypothetical protein